MDKNITVFFFHLLFVSLFLSTSQKIVIEKIISPVIHGEGPFWDIDYNVLYFVDIINQTVYKYNPKKRKLNYVYVEGGPVSLVIPDSMTEKYFVLGRGHDVVKMAWDGISTTPSEMEVLATVDADKPGNRFNDGKADFRGTLWIGTMGPEFPRLQMNQGSLYSVSVSDLFRPKKQLSPVSVSNGIEWNLNGTIMYYIDSPKRTVSAFDFDLNNEKLSNRREIFNLNHHGISGVPDGMCIDRRGNIWVALYGGGAVVQIDPKNGRYLNKINIPAKLVTSCTFGGFNLKYMYVTTSRVSLSARDIRYQPLSGAVFRISGLNTGGYAKPNKVLLL